MENRRAGIGNLLGWYLLECGSRTHRKMPTTLEKAPTIEAGHFREDESLIHRRLAEQADDSPFGKCSVSLPADRSCRGTIAMALAGEPEQYPGPPRGVVYFDWAAKLAVETAAGCQPAPEAARYRLDSSQ
jgi:hypothetical protein